MIHLFCEKKKTLDNCEQIISTVCSWSGHVAAAHFSVVSLHLWQDGDNCWPGSAERFACRWIVLPHILFPGLLQEKTQSSKQINQPTSQQTNTYSIAFVYKVMPLSKTWIFYKGCMTHRHTFYMTWVMETKHLSFLYILEDCYGYLHSTNWDIHIVTQYVWADCTLGITLIWREDLVT